MVCLNKSKQYNAWNGLVPDYSILFVDMSEHKLEKDIEIYSWELLRLKYPNYRVSSGSEKGP